MQLLKSITEPFLNRTPQQPSEPSRSADDPLPSSDAAAAPPVREALLSVPSGSDFASFDGLSTQITPHSDAKRLSAKRNPSSVSRLLRRSNLPSGLGMPTLSRNKNQKRRTDESSRADELRLFGDNGRPDPDAVRIIPGQMYNNKKPAQKIPSAFKPVDKISKGIRQSGLVRVYGKEPQNPSTSQRHSALSRPVSNQVADTSERSSKRRRVENPEEPRRRISISDDDAMDRSTIRSSPVATRSNALSPTPSQLSSQSKWSSHASEYRNVDKTTRVPRLSPRKETRIIDRFSSEDDKDIGFTHNAAEERRKGSRISGADVRQASPMQPQEDPGFSVKIPSQVRVSLPAKTRSSLARESPDELQGDATVHPVPRSLDRSKRDQTSPSDIRPTTFASDEKRVRKSRKGKSNNKRSASEAFKLGFFRTGPLLYDALGGENDKLQLDSLNDRIIITVADGGIIREISLGRINKILVGDEQSRKIRLELPKDSSERSRDHKIDIELLTSDEKARFASRVQKLNEARTIKIEVQGKPGKWLDKAFTKSKRENQLSNSTEDQHKRPLDVLDATEELPKQLLEPYKRPKLSDALRDSDGKTAVNPSINSGGAQLTKRSSPSVVAKDVPALNFGGTANEVEIPVKKYNPILQAPVRATRSMARREPTTLVCDDDEGDENFISQLNDEVNQKWDKKPLVYPRYGKKKAEVNALDLERLAPHQFLNDNIIGLYMRFLEDHLQRCNAEVARRVYFFNSYFFATLTNSPKGRRNINYEGVEKWTRNVELFSYDYIIIPINEDAHWYVVIICNLPYLEGISVQGQPSTSRPPSEIREVPETPEPTKPDEEQGPSLPQFPKEESTRQSLASMVISEKQASQANGSRSGEEEWPEREELPRPPCAQFSVSSSQSLSDSQISSTPKKGRKSKKKMPLGKKYDVDQPIIITFDSLGAPRESTIRTLKDYLCAEAKSKRDTEINKTLISGMKARQVPEQKNYSDCGLYLLAYIEKFIRDPDLFVRKLLRKEMRLEDWPPLRSNLLRSRLRTFMEQLYSEQEQLTKEKAEGAGLMVDQQPMSYLLGSSSDDDSHRKDEARKSPQADHSKQAKLKLKDTPRSEPPAQQHSPKPEIIEGPNPTTLETQDSVIQIGPVDDSSMRSLKPSTRRQPRNCEVIEVPDSQDQANAPFAGTSQPTESGPSMSPRKSPRHEVSLYIDDSDGIEATTPERKNRPPKSGGFEVQIQVKGTPPGSPRLG
ncbi:hypothetical protein BJX64DRAFT_258989 [Aspergillus heterothallicus]